jgi:exodeoxyribonuclease V beta subunit
MHAAKGLEFPVVFLMCKAKPKSAVGPDTLLWDDGGKERTKRFTPFFKIDDLRNNDAAPLQSYTEDQRRERKRLLYVAMTRPKAMLFVPMYGKKTVKEKIDGAETEKEMETEQDLSPHIRALIGNDDNVEIFDAERFNANRGQSTKKESDETRQPTELPETLPLQKFISKESSFSLMNRELKRREQEEGNNPTATPIDGNEDVPRGDEYHAEDQINAENTSVNATANTAAAQPLPGGSQTGDALHRAIEELLNADDIRAILDNNDTLEKIVHKHLLDGGILNSIAKKSNDPKTAGQAAIKQAASMIKSALTTPYPAPNGNGTVVFADIPKSDRRPEIEFLMSRETDQNEEYNANKISRIRGFIDLVFRLPNESYPPHPYRYYFADWKSSILESYNREAVRQYCEEQNYTLQAQIYTNALNKYLAGILGNRYSQKENMGGALFVFLRETGACWSFGGTPKEQNIPLDSRPNH